MTHENYSLAGPILARIQLAENNLNLWAKAEAYTGSFRVKTYNGNGYSSWEDLPFKLPFDELKARAVSYWTNTLEQAKKEFEAL